MDKTEKMENRALRKTNRKTAAAKGLAVAAMACALSAVLVAAVGIVFGAIAFGTAKRNKIACEK